MQFSTKIQLCVICVLLTLQLSAQEDSVIISGTVVDETDFTIPYAAITIPSKNIGTTSTEEGSYYLSVSKNDLQDTLVVSSMGFETYKILVKEYVDKKMTSIVLKENITALDVVEISNAKDVLKESLKSVDENYISKTHQLKLLYRRTSVEKNVSKFFVEQYISLLYNGPGTYARKIAVTESRKSADYRFVKVKQNRHALNIMLEINPLANPQQLKRMEWEKIGDTNYDDEGVVILEGTKGHTKIKMYIGIETNAIYRIENSELDAVFIYKKNKDGKLFLSYHNREWISTQTVNSETQKLLKLNSRKVKASYRHEVFVLGIETDKKKTKMKDFGGEGTDMGDLKIPYHEAFWKNLSLPPETAFYKKIKAELESNYGVPLETQFKYAN